MALPPTLDGHQHAPLRRFTTLTGAHRHALDSFFFSWAKALLPVLVPGANVVVASHALVSYLVAGAVVRAGFERRAEIVRLVMTLRGGDRPEELAPRVPGRERDAALEVGAVAAFPEAPGGTMRRG
jgi:hypothetical protein